MMGRKVAKKKPTNWPEIEKEYVEGVMVDGERTYPSQPALCEKYGISTGAIGKKASADQWKVKREIFSSKLREATQEKKIEVISTEGSSFDLTCFNVAVKATEILEHKINKSGPDGFFLIDDLNKLSATLKNLQVVGRLALGEPIDISKSSGDIKINPDVANDPAKLEARIRELNEARERRSRTSDTP